MRRRPHPLAAALVLAAALAACGKSSSPTANSGFDAITIASISPANGTQLHPGMTVAFTATVSYSLVSAASATISQIYEDQNGFILNPTSQVVHSINAGAGTVSFTDTFTVPATGVTTLLVFFPLLPAGATGTNTAVTATYPVG